MIRTKQEKFSVLLHFLLFAIVASAVLSYWYAAEEALSFWQPIYYQLPYYISLVPTWQKVLKDLLALLLLGCSLIVPPTTPIKYQDKSLKIIYALGLLVLSIAIARNIASSLGIREIIYSLRPFVFAFSLFTFCHRHLNLLNLKYVLEGLNFLVIIQLYYSILQRQAAVINNGAAWLGFGFVRSVGTFTGPNTLGFFLAFIIYINLYLLLSNKWRYFIVLLCLICLFFTNSRTAFFIVFLLFIEKVFALLLKKSKTHRERFLTIWLGIVSSPIVLALVLFQVRNLSEREAGDSVSGGRIEILLGYIDQTDALSILLGRYLGYGSEILITLSRGQDFSVQIEQAFIADSTWTSLLYQFGILGIVVYLLIIYEFCKLPYVADFLEPLAKLRLVSQRLGLLIFIFGVSATSVVLESYAIMPILVALLFALRMQRILLEQDIQKANYI